MYERRREDVCGGHERVETEVRVWLDVMANHYRTVPAQSGDLVLDKRLRPRKVGADRVCDHWIRCRRSIRIHDRLADPGGCDRGARALTVRI